MVFGIEGVGVGPVVGHVTGSIVGKPCVGDLVVGVDAQAEHIRGTAGHVWRFGEQIAPSVVAELLSPAIGTGSAGGLGGGEAIERVIGKILGEGGGEIVVDVEDVAVVVARVEVVGVIHERGRGVC